MKFKLFIFFLFVICSLGKSFAGSYIIYPKKIGDDLNKKLSFATPLISPSLRQNKKVKSALSSNNFHLNRLFNYLIIDEKDISSINPEDYEIYPNYIFTIESNGKIGDDTNDPELDKQWYLKAVNAQKAWQISKGEQIIIGLIDTGFDWEHPDLVGQYWINQKEDINNNGRFDAWSSEEKDSLGVFGDLNGIDDDGNGFQDDVIGYDFVDQSVANFGDWSLPDAIPFDEARHGTSVGGVMVAAQNNNEGISGLSPSAKVMTLRAFDGGGNAESDDIARSIIYGVLNGADVLNFSWGERYDSQILLDAIRFAHSVGVVMVGSSGNNNWTREHYPSDYPEVISVGGSDEDGLKYGKGNYGSFVDISAPGQNILTTQAHGEYISQGGTSLASPLVSAACALILAQNKNLSPEQIRLILQKNAFDAGDFGFDTEFGAGILDVAKSVENIIPIEFNISYPTHNSSFNTDQDTLNINGEFFHPLINSWEIFLGQGHFPDEISPEDKIILSEEFDIDLSEVDYLAEEILFDYKWKSVASGVGQVSGNIATIDIKNLKDTLYVGRVICQLKNNSTYERRFRFSLYDNENKMKILSTKQDYAYHNGIKQTLITAILNKKARVSLNYISEDSDSEIKTINSESRDMINHTFYLPDDLQNNSSATITALDDKYNDFVEIKFSIEKSYFPKSGFARKSYSLPLSYIWGKSSDFSPDGEKYILLNDLSSLSIGKTKIYRFEKDSFALFDSSLSRWIPVGWGDSDGDGKKEILGTMFRSSTLFEFENEKIVLENPVWESSSEVTWGEAMFDFDGDGREELVLNNEEKYFVMKYNDSGFDTLAFLEIPEKYATLGTSRFPAIGRFNENDKPDIAIANSYGMIFVYEFQKNTSEFKLISSRTNQETNTSRFTIASDIDGDEIDEIINLSYGTFPIFGTSVNSDPIWFLRIFAFDKNSDSLKLIASEKFRGVRDAAASSTSPFFRNGLSSGKISSAKKNDIIISTFPNLYVMSWDLDLKKLKALWHHPNVLANDIVVDDFDGNGQNEIGFSTFNGLEFFEYQNKLLPPSKFTGFSLGNNSVKLNWIKAENTTDYRIYYLENDSNLFSIGTTKNTELILDENILDLENNKKYYFAIQSIDSSKKSVQNSDFAQADVFVHDLIRAETASYSPSGLEIKYNGRIAQNHELKSFIIKNKNNFKLINPVNIIKSSENSLILILSEKLENGDYEIETKSIYDYYNSPTIESKLDFSVNIPDEEEEMTLVSLDVSVNNRELELRFSHDISPDALDINNYQILPYGSIARIENDENSPKSVKIYLNSGLSEGRGKDFTIEAKNINSLGGIPITKGSGHILSFVISSDNLSDPFLYPSPIVYGESENIYFANLTNSAEIEIFTMDGVLQRTLSERDGNGGTVWDGRDELGKLLSPGIYLYKINGINSSGDKKDSALQKFMIVSP
jgi:subtilisin family serine protease